MFVKPFLILLTAFRSETNVKHFNSSLTPKMLEKAITTVNLSDTSCLYFSGDSEIISAYTFIYITKFSLIFN